MPTCVAARRRCSAGSSAGQPTTTGSGSHWPGYASRRTRADFSTSRQIRAGDGGQPAAQVVDLARRPARWRSAARPPAPRPPPRRGCPASGRRPPSRCGALGLELGRQVRHDATFSATLPGPTGSACDTVGAETRISWTRALVGDGGERRGDHAGGLAGLAGPPARRGRASPCCAGPGRTCRPGTRWSVPTPATRCPGCCAAGWRRSTVPVTPGPHGELFLGPRRAATRPYAAPAGALPAVRPGPGARRPAAPRPAGAVPAGGRVRRRRPGTPSTLLRAYRMLDQQLRDHAPLLSRCVDGVLDAGRGHGRGRRHRRRARAARRPARRYAFADGTFDDLGSPAAPPDAGADDQRAVEPPVRLGRPTSPSPPRAAPAARAGPLGPRGRAYRADLRRCRPVRGGPGRPRMLATGELRRAAGVDRASRDVRPPGTRAGILSRHSGDPAAGHGSAGCAPGV